MTTLEEMCKRVIEVREKAKAICDCPKGVKYDDCPTVVSGVLFRQMSYDLAEPLAKACLVLLKEISDTVAYLDSNNLNLILSNSSGHRDLKHALARAEEIMRGGKWI